MLEAVEYAEKIRLEPVVTTIRSLFSSSSGRQGYGDRLVGFDADLRPKARYLILYKWFVDF